MPEKSCLDHHQKITSQADGQMNLFESTMETGKRTVQGTEKDNSSLLYKDSKATRESEPKCWQDFQKI